MLSLGEGFAEHVKSVVTKAKLEELEKDGRQPLPRLRVLRPFPIILSFFRFSEMLGMTMMS